MCKFTIPEFSKTKRAKEAETGAVVFTYMRRFFPRHPPSCTFRTLDPTSVLQPWYKTLNISYCFGSEIQFIFGSLHIGPFLQKAQHMLSDRKTK